MPTCPECGLDVQREGLCRECKTYREKKKTFANTSDADTGAQESSQLLIKVAIAIILFISGFIAGWIIFAQPPNTLTNDASIPIINGSETEKSVQQEDTKKYFGADEKSAKYDIDNGALNTASDLRFDLLDRKEKVPVNEKASYISWMTSNTKEKKEYLEKRWKCSQTLLAWSKSRSITRTSVLEAFLLTPRENFCRQKNLARAYEFSYLDIGWGQTISGPEIVARMTNALDPEPGHRVLEIGTGSGYQAAILSELSNNVYTIEIIRELARITDGIYESLESDYPRYKNIRRKIADGYFGWEESSPFDRIIVTCGIDHIPPPLLKQLAPEGIMVIPVGPPSGQTILKVVKHIDEKGNITLDREDIYKGSGFAGDQFVPFKATDGTSHSAARDLNE